MFVSFEMNRTSLLAQDVQKINELTRLNTLSLSRNPLLTIPALSLPQLTYLQLENTDLHSARFPPSFENCTQLESIVLSNNALNTITADDFRSLSSPLRKLSIENSQLHSIDRTAFVRLSNTLESISLLSNSLTSADFFPTMTNLLSMNLDNNDFKELPREIRQPGRTKHFFFRHNKIEVINESSPLFDWAQTNITGVNIYLNNNPFDCCRSRWFIDYLSGPKNLVHDAGKLTCASPEDYSGQRLIDLRSNRMDCDMSLFHRFALHSDKFLIVLICLLSIATFIIVVVGTTLYRHSRLNLRRRNNYEQY